MTEEQFNVLLDLQRLNLHISMRTEAKVMVLMQVCTSAQEQMLVAAGEEPLPQKKLTSHILGLFDHHYPQIVARYQPEIDRILGQLQD